MMGLVAVYGKLGERALAPGVGTTHTMNIQIDVQVHEPTSWHFIGMTHTQVFLTIVPGSDTERLVTINTDLSCWRCYLKPTDIATVTVILRMDILCLVILQRCLIDTKEYQWLWVGSSCQP